MPVTKKWFNEKLVITQLAVLPITGVRTGWQTNQMSEGDVDNLSESLCVGR